MRDSVHFNGYFPGEPGLAGTGMSLFWILLELRVMEVAVTTGAIRRAMVWYGILEFNISLDTV